MSYLKSLLDARNIKMEDVIKASNDLPRRTMSDVLNEHYDNGVDLLLEKIEGPLYSIRKG